MIGGTNNSLYPAFKALLEVLCYPIALIDKRGRVGGIVALALGVLMIAAGGWIIAGTTSLLGLGVSGIGVAYCFYGFSRLMGREARLYRGLDAAPSVAEPLSRQELKSVLKTRALPFFVCARCRVVMSPAECGGNCLRCRSDADCIPVREQGDRRIAWSSIY